MTEHDEVMQDVSGSRETFVPSAILLRDRQGCVPLGNALASDGVVLLLTPLVVPPASQAGGDQDPFEPLGRDLAKVHPKIRHVPYSQNGGITGHHVAFMKRADLVLFIITGLSVDDETSQAELAAAVGDACSPMPLVVIFCCDVDEQLLEKLDFPTSIRATGFSVPDLEAVSNLLLYGAPAAQSSSSLSTANLKEVERRLSWAVEVWEFERDLDDIYALWIEYTPRQFHMDKTKFSGLVRRDGFAMHYVVRNESGNGILGFCATYTTYADGSGEQLIGSIAAIVVRRELQGRGIGLSLHEAALAKLKRIRGMRHVQLGTTFPRILAGVPVHHPSMGWFSKRGWEFDQSSPGKGRLVTDWLLQLNDSPLPTLASAGLNFRSCGLQDYEIVTKMVEHEALKRHGFGWPDQYAQILDGAFLGDVLLGFEGSTLVAAAITHVPHSGNPIASDIVWPASIGPEVGGISCICIRDDPGMVTRRDTIMVRLLHSCCKSLNDRGMGGVFLDGVNSSESGVETLGESANKTLSNNAHDGNFATDACAKMQLTKGTIEGFRPWAQYHEIWQRV